MIKTVMNRILKRLSLGNRQKITNSINNDVSENVVTSPSMHQQLHFELTEVEKLKNLYSKYPQFVKHRADLQGYPEKDYLNAKLKLVQDLCIVDFITNNLNPGSKILEIGGGLSRVLSYFQNEYECWCLDKFEGIGNGPEQLPENHNYIIIQNYIGAFDSNLPTNYFDLVFSISVVEHINMGDQECLKIVQDIDRLLKPDSFNLHCIDCRFPPKQKADISKRKLAKYMLKYYGFDENYIYSNYKKKAVFTMSEKAYDRFWKKACGNRPHTLDGLPFNIFLASKKSEF